MGDGFMGGGGPLGGMPHRAPLRPGIAGGGLPLPLGPGALGGRAGPPMGPPGGPPPGGRHVMLGQPGPGPRHAPEDGGGPRAGPHSAGFSLALGMDAEPAPGGCARALSGPMGTQCRSCGGAGRRACELALPCGAGCVVTAARARRCTRAPL